MGLRADFRFNPLLTRLNKSVNRWFPVNLFCMDSGELKTCEIKNGKCVWKSMTVRIESMPVRVCLSPSVSLSVCLSLSVSVCVCVYLFPFVCVCLCPSVFCRVMCVSVCVSVCLWAFLCVSLFSCVFLASRCVSVSLCVSMSLCVSSWVCVFICSSVRVFVRATGSVCFCACLCTCVYLLCMTQHKITWQSRTWYHIA